MSKRLQRHTWEDALIDAQTAKVIPNGALLLALKLAKAINWAPRKHSKPGLYWDNDEALQAVGAGRSTYFKHRDALFEAGFFTMEKQNLIPTLPPESTVETEKSTVETSESTVETEESTPWTEKSTGEHPFSVDTLSVETLSDDLLSEDVCGAAVADAPAVDSKEDQDEEDDQPILCSEGSGGAAKPIPEKYFYKGKSRFAAESKDDGAGKDSEEGGRKSTPWTDGGKTAEGQDIDYAAEAERAGITYYYEAALKVPTLSGKPCSPKSAYKTALRSAGKDTP